MAGGPSGRGHECVPGHPRSTVYAVLRRHGLHRLAWMDRPTGRVIRRYERARAGELIHVDVKKLGRIPPGGGWRIHGRGPTTARDKRRRLGCDYLHAAVDDHSRLAYVEVHSEQRSAPTAAFLRRAGAFFASRGVAVERVMTDNAWSYRLSPPFQAAVSDLGARHILIPPRRPQVNGKVERFNRTLLEEWALSASPTRTKLAFGRSTDGWSSRIRAVPTPRWVAGHQPRGCKQR